MKMKIIDSVHLNSKETHVELFEFMCIELNSTCALNSLQELEAIVNQRKDYGTAFEINF